MSSLSAFSLKGWIDEHRPMLKPPVGNAVIWKDADFMVMIVAGPNQRKDYHVNPTEEFYYQIEGDIHVKVIENGVKRDIPIREGEIFLLPPNIPHSPQRPAGTIGMVVERKRHEDEHDHLTWFCDNCGHVLYDASFYLTNLATQIKPVIEKFNSDEKLRKCGKCGTVMQLAAK